MTELHPGDLLIGTYPVATRSVIVAAGADLVRGAVLGKITATKKYALSASAAVDGSETPALILAVDVLAAGGDVNAVAYGSGEFDSRQLTLGVGHTVESVSEALSDASAPMFIKTPA